MFHRVRHMINILLALVLIAVAYINIFSSLDLYLSFAMCLYDSVI